MYIIIYVYIIVKLDYTLEIIRRHHSKKPNFPTGSPTLCPPKRPTQRRRRHGCKEQILAAALRRKGCGDAEIFAEGGEDRGRGKAESSGKGEEHCVGNLELSIPGFNMIRHEELSKKGVNMSEFDLNILNIKTAWRWIECYTI